MVAARQNNNLKRKNGKPGANNMRKNFKPGGGQLQQQQQQHNGGFKQQIRINNGNVRGNNMNRLMNVNFNPMFAPNQMNDPGYMDFNEPSVRQFPPKNSYQKNANNVNPMNMNGQNGGGGGVGGGGGGGGVGNKNNNNKNRGRMNFNKPRNNNNINAANNGLNMGNNANVRMGNGRNFAMNGIGGGNNGPFRNGPPRIPFNDAPMPGGGAGMRPNDNFGGPQFFPPQRFGPMMPPQIGMRPPIGRPMMARRPLPPPPAVMIPPFRGGGGNNGRPMRRKIGNGAPPVQNVNNPRRPPNNPKGGIKNRRKNDRKATKKLNFSVDKYPLTKPWVTDEIKAAHDKKVELSNQLKGKKDDQLFAEFKIQRDAFVKLYETARDEFNAANKKQVIYSKICTFASFRWVVACLQSHSFIYARHNLTSN